MRRVLTALALSFAAFTGAHAQKSPVRAPEVELREALVRAEAGNWTVRASLRDQSILKGRINAIRRGAFEIGVKALPLDHVERLDRLVRAGGGGKRGFLLGALAGTALVYQLAQALSGGDPDDPGVLIVSAALGTILGGPPGALVGSSIDPPTIHWVAFWP